MAHGKRDKRAGALAVGTPDSFDKRRVRWSFVKGKDHVSAPGSGARYGRAWSGFAMCMRFLRLSERVDLFDPLHQFLITRFGDAEDCQPVLKVAVKLRRSRMG